MSLDYLTSSCNQFQNVGMLKKLQIIAILVYVLLEDIY